MAKLKEFVKNEKQRLKDKMQFLSPNLRALLNKTDTELGDFESDIITKAGPKHYRMMETETIMGINRSICQEERIISEGYDLSQIVRETKRSNKIKVKEDKDNKK